MIIAVDLLSYERTEQLLPILCNNDWIRVFGSSLQLAPLPYCPLGYIVLIRRPRNCHCLALSLSSIFLPFELFFVLAYSQKHTGGVGYIPGMNQIEYRALKPAQGPERVS